MAFKIILIVIAFIYVVFNFITAKLMNAKEMKHEFVDGQCTVGRVFSNIFYAPAWFLKAIRFIVVSTIK